MTCRAPLAGFLHGVLGVPACLGALGRPLCAAGRTRAALLCGLITLLFSLLSCLLCKAALRRTLAALADRAGSQPLAFLFYRFPFSDNLFSPC